MPKPRHHGGGRLGAIPLALSITAAYLVVGGVAGGWVLHAKTSTAGPVAVPTSAPPIPRITTTAAPVAPASSAPLTTTTAAPQPLSPPAGFHLVEAPWGLVAAVPEGWPIDTGTVATTFVAADPTDPRREVRVGGAPITDRSKSLLDRITAAAGEREREPGHTRIGLAGTRVREFPAVRWDFEEGVERMAAAYWETKGVEYVLYASGPIAEWPRTQERLTAMIDFSRP